ncbi:hypothetical protein DH2020_019070 [Rehmannia glutinosa]|uniref:Thioredoxin domain-containing protein n=1 Tax=Rehmannia glutinosa TaxID=99300 RepID=A0ABR0WMQ9_REHGL
MLSIPANSAQTHDHVHGHDQIVCVCSSLFFLQSSRHTTVCMGTSRSCALLREREREEEMATSSESEGQMISCHTVEAWDEQLQKGTDNKKLIVVDFTISWCGPCRFITPFFAELAKKLPNVTILKVDVDELKSVASDWAVEAMPTFIFLQEGEILDRVVGAKKQELQQTIVKHLNLVTA